MQINQMPNTLARPAAAALSDCSECPIRLHAVCARCEASELAELERIKFYRSFSAGEAILWAQEPVEFVGSLVSGVATITQTLEDGRRQMVGLLLPSDFVGRPGQAIARYDVTAATDVLLCCFRPRAFEALLQRKPEIAHRLLEMTLDELDAAREWMLVLGRKTAREKIASLFVIFARREAKRQRAKVAQELVIDLPLSRETMADYLGLTLETVSRQISALRKDGVLTLLSARKVLIPRFDRLLEAAGDDSDGGFVL